MSLKWLPYLAKWRFGLKPRGNTLVHPRSSKTGGGVTPERITPMTDKIWGSWASVDSQGQLQVLLPPVILPQSRISTCGKDFSQLHSSNIWGFLAQNGTECVVETCSKNSSGALRSPYWVNVVIILAEELGFLNFAPKPCVLKSSITRGNAAHIDSTSALKIRTPIKSGYVE